MNFYQCDGQDILAKLNRFKFDAILILNITSFSNGTHPWNRSVSGFESQCMSDGRVEVIGFHAADFV